jgi:hypothetical protein
MDKENYRIRGFMIPALHQYYEYYGLECIEGGRAYSTHGRNAYIIFFERPRHTLCGNIKINLKETRC